MKITFHQGRERGYVSFVLVLSSGLVLSMLMLYGYFRAMSAQAVQAQVQLRADYSEKEEAVLRSIVAITPNRAIRAMQDGSNANAAASTPLSWDTIFGESLELANAGASISDELLTSLNISDLRSANTGDSSLGNASRIFKAIPPDTGFVSPGINQSYQSGYPPPLTVDDSITSTRDLVYPIIAHSKRYGNAAQAGVGLPVSSYPQFNLLKYPEINFGYASPGEYFVAKRNWWAFSMNIGSHDAEQTALARVDREFVLSIYEVPSQLAISAASFMTLGKHESGEDWQNVTIEGGVFAGKAKLEGNVAIDALASRRGVNLSTGAMIGGQSFTSSPFTPGVRETYQLTQGNFYPVSLTSESGRVAFVPINRGADYFDRFAHDGESSVLSTTSWNQYSVGALQCAMQMDITEVRSATDRTPTMLRFSYLTPTGMRASMSVPQTVAPMSTLPAGYVQVALENQSYTFPTAVDVAYGTSGGFTFRQGVTGTVQFNNSTFGDPKIGSPKAGYWRPRFPSEVRTLSSGNRCVTVYPERIPALLAAIGGAGPDVNHSIVVNVDYSVTGLNDPTAKPSIPCTDNDYGVILAECANLTPFTKGFSLVTNLRLYMGDDFNIVAATPPSGYTPTGTYFPPCSLFSPEKRYGVEVNPFAVTMGGQLGSLVSDSSVAPVRPLDPKNLSGNVMDSSRITANLRPITHPAELPPISMMNWLVTLEELGKNGR